MRQRGRKSAEQLSPVPLSDQQRPDPPERLSELEAEEWRTIVARMPADWFSPETWPLLEHLCGHIVSAHLIQESRRKLQDKLTSDEYEKLTRLFDMEGKAIGALSMKLRLAPQSRYDVTRANTAYKRNATASQKPWAKQQVA